MRIDFHTHCFPDKIAARAMDNLSRMAAIHPVTDGTATGLVSMMEEDGIDKSVVLSIATNAHQQKAVNDFAASIQSEKLCAFGSVFPDAPDALDELERIKMIGLCGVKLHPEYQQFYVDDEKMKPIYKKISELGLILTFHAGVDNGYPPPYHCMPKNLLRALLWLDTPVVAAHWGGQGCNAEVLDKLCGIEQLYFDTAYGYGTVVPALAKKIIEKHGADKILFASDAPWNRPSQDEYVIECLRLSEEEKEMIYYKNALKLLGGK